MGNSRKKTNSRFAKAHLVEHSIVSKTFFIELEGIPYRIKTSQIKTIGFNSSILGILGITSQGRKIFKSGFVVNADRYFEESINKVSTRIDAVLLMCFTEIYCHYKPLAIEIGDAYKIC